MLVAFGISPMEIKLCGRYNEHSVFIDIIRKISFQYGEKGEMAKLILRNHELLLLHISGTTKLHSDDQESVFLTTSQMLFLNSTRPLDEKNSSDVNAFWRNRDNIDILRKRKLWQIESSDLDYIHMRDQQLEKQVKLIRDNTIKAQYIEQTQSRFFETNASVMNISSILNDTEKSHSIIVPNDDSFKTPPPRPREITLTTPQKSTLCDQTMQHLVRHFSVNVNKQCVIMKAEKVDTFPKEIRNWLVDVLSSEKGAFENAIMSTPNPDHPFREVCKNILFDLGAKMLFPEFDLTLHKVDGIGFKVSSNKEIVFIEVSGGSEDPVLKHVREDTEKLIKEAMMPFSFEEVEKFIEVFELLYALVDDGLKNQSSSLKKIMLSDSISNGPTVRDWIWVPNTNSTWENTE
ncbi:2049_t:CDS:10, partial [Acaulospora morrowiae]